MLGFNYLMCTIFTVGQVVSPMVRQQTKVIASQHANLAGKIWILNCIIVNLYFVLFSYVTGSEQYKFWCKIVCKLSAYFPVGQNAAAFTLGGGTRPQKIIVTQAGASQNISAGTIITTVAKTSNVGGQALPRQQKVISHPGSTIATTTSMSTKGGTFVS